MAHIPMPGAAIPYRPPNNLDDGPNMKGGGLRGGPRRWTGRGPQPARHIPWPEIFKHHISLIEGHHKMLDMVRKHTVEGSGNHRMITDLLNRSKQILHDTQQMSRNFVPPKDARDKVPLGAGSASMYPGYSPADHEYGNAAMEYGKAVAEARAQGINFRPGMDIDYEIGQARGTKRKTLEGIKTAKVARDAAENEAMGTGDNALPVENGGVKRKGALEEKNVDTNGMSSPRPAPASTAQEKTTQEDKVIFSLDANPTPATLEKIHNDAFHHEAPLADKPFDEISKEKTSKKRKTTHKGPLPEPPRFEDISAEVDARVKEKEEKRKQREARKAQKKLEKKRKRESGDSVMTSGGEGAAAMGGTADIADKPKKKKSKKAKNDGEVNGDGSKKRASEEREIPNEEGKKSSKRRKKEKAANGVI